MLNWRLARMKEEKGRRGVVLIDRREQELEVSAWMIGSTDSNLTSIDASLTLTDSGCLEIWKSTTILLTFFTLPASPKLVP